MIKNRKLVIRNTELAKYFNTAEIEKAIAEVRDWDGFSDEKTQISGLFSWDETPQGYTFWGVVDKAFTVEPLNTIATLKEIIATAEATMADAKKRLAEMGE